MTEYDVDSYDSGVRYDEDIKPRERAAFFGTGPRARNGCGAARPAGRGRSFGGFEIMSEVLIFSGGRLKM